MAGIEDKTKRKETEPHLQGDQCLLDKEVHKREVL